MRTPPPSLRWGGFLSSAGIPLYWVGIIPPVRGPITDSVTTSWRHDGA